MASIRRKALGFVGYASLTCAVLAVLGAPGIAGGAVRSHSGIPGWLTNAIQVSNAAQGPQTVWTGPTTGPKIAPNKSIVYISGDEALSVESLWGKYLQEAGKVAGWKVTIIDGKGSTAGWTTAFDQAIALHPDGIVSTTDAVTMHKEIVEATKAGIPVVGIHMTSSPGPHPSLDMFYDIQSSPVQVGQIVADYAIATSDGHAKALIVTDNEYAIAFTKSMAMKAAFQKCTTCTLLEYTNIPLAQMTTLMPPATTKWVETEPKPFYVLTIGDVYFDYMVPTLKSGGVSPSSVILVGGDSSASGLQRIKAGQYEVAYTPEPDRLQAFEAIDQLNRAIHHLPADNFVNPAHLVTLSNLTLEQNADGVFDPANNYQAHYKAIWFGKS